MTERPELDRDAAIARAKALAAARREAPGSPEAPHPGPPGEAIVRTGPAAPPRSRNAGPSSGRILAAAGATAAGVGLVGVMALSAQSGASAAEPAPPPAPAPVTEYRTVVIQVPAGTQAGDPLVDTAVAAIAAEQPMPAPAASDRTPATQTEGS